MALGFDSRIGIAGLAVGVIGIAIAILYPDKKWLGWTFLAIGSVILLLWGVLEIKQWVESPRLSLFISIVVGCIVGGVMSTLMWRAAHSRKPDSTTSDADIQLSIICESVSLPVPYSGDIYMLTTFGSGGISRLSTGIINKEGLWPEEGVKGFGYKCTVKNYGAKTAFGISMPITITEFEWVQLEPAMWGDGKKKNEHTFETFIPIPLGPQGSDQFSFYVCSFDTERSLKVKLPLAGFVDSDDPKNKREVVVRIASPINPLPVSAKLLRTLSVLPHEETIPRITAEAFPEKPGSSQYDNTPGASVLVTALTTYRSPVLEMECNVPCTFIAGLSFFQGKHVSSTMLEQLPALPDRPNLIRIKMLMPVKLETDEQLTLQFRSKDNRELEITNVRPHFGKL